MKNILLTLITSGVLLSGAVYDALAQQENDKVFIGTTSQLLDQLVTKPTRADANAKTAYADVTIAVAPKTVLTVSTHVKKQKENTNSFIGKVASYENSSFFLSIRGNHAEGKIILQKEKLAYEISSDMKGNVYVQNIDINKVLCVDFNELPANKRVQKSLRQAVNPSTDNVYALQSYPGSAFVAYLDFDGEYFSNSGWNGGKPIDALPSGMTDADILEAWEIVSEDYRAFDLNITTDVNVFNAAKPGQRIRCMITPTNTAGPGYGGIAYIGGFTWTDYEEPCWSFTSGVGTGGKNVGEVSSHEIGHTLLLGHDGRTEPSEVYYAGAGDWAPIMGVGYYENIVQFSKGEYLNANNGEDDITVIATRNGFTFREDDHDDNTTHATDIVQQADLVLATANNGVISQRSDVDFFSFSTSGGEVNLSFNGSNRHSNLDIVVKLYDQNYNLIDRLDQEGLNVLLTKNLKAGLYYVSVDGTGHGDPLVDGYTDYSSLGSYTISGTIPQSNSVNTYPTVAITSPSNNEQFPFPGQVTIQAIASDSDGSIAKVEFYNGSHKLGEALLPPYSFTWTNIPSGTFSLLAKATDDKGAITTSEAVIIVVNPATDNCSNTIAWSANQVYAAPGQRVAYEGNIFENKWWTQNDQPDLSNAWGVWKFIGPCSSTHLNLKPTVSFIAPVHPYFQAGNHTVVIASASDADGSIQKVDFYENDTYLSTSTVAPYSIDKSNIQAGLHHIKAIATDNLGAVSDPAFLTLTVDALPTFASPLANTDYSFGGTVNLQINANGGESRISKVEYFFSGLTEKVGEVFVSPYSLVYSPIPAGTSSRGSFLPILAKVTYAHGGIVVIDTYIHVTNTVQINLCTNLTTYTENGGYTAGNTVKNSDRMYECRPWPYSGWCNSAAVAYAPGTGTNWQDAWIDKGSCTGEAKRHMVNNSLSDLISLFPNPTEDILQLDFGNYGEVAQVMVYDALGNLVVDNVKLQTGQSIDLSMLSKGLYNFHITIGGEITYRKVVKY